MSGANRGKPHSNPNASTMSESDHHRYTDSHQGAHHPGSGNDAHDHDEGHDHHEEGGHGHHHRPTLEDAMEGNEKIAQAIEKAMQEWRVDPYSLDWSTLYTGVHGRVYDQWWKHPSQWSFASVACRAELARYRYCEETLIVDVRTPIHWAEDENNPCGEEGFHASVCVAPIMWPGMNIDYSKLTPNQGWRIADITFPLMRLASATIQIPADWAIITKFCDTDGKPSQNTIPNNNTIGCIIPKAWPQDYSDLVECLTINNSQDITHPNCQLPVLAIAQKWGALQKVREIVGDDFENKAIFPEFIDPHRTGIVKKRTRSNDAKIKRDEEADRWLQRVMEKRSGSTNDFLSLDLNDFGDEDVGNQYDEDKEQ